MCTCMDHLYNSESFLRRVRLGGKNSYIYMSPLADGINKSNSVCRGNVDFSVNFHLIPMLYLRCGLVLFKQL